MFQTCGGRENAGELSEGEALLETSWLVVMTVHGVSPCQVTRGPRLLRWADTMASWGCSGFGVLTGG